MKIQSEIVENTYTLDGSATFNEAGVMSHLDQEMSIRYCPRGFFSNNQKRIIHRQLKDSDESSSTELFLADLTRPIEEVEIEFDRNNVPVRLLNHKDIYRKWIDNIDSYLSRYDGQWAIDTIQLLGRRYADEELVFDAIRQEVFLYELYSRRLYTIEFSDTDKSTLRQWNEHLFESDWIINQQCRYSCDNVSEVIHIDGIGDPEKNKDSIQKFCIDRNIDPAVFGQITQQTTYSGRHLSQIPNSINSRYTITDTDANTLSEITVKITLK